MCELPVYQPGSIQLESRENDDFIRQYRDLHYSIKGTFGELLSEEELEDFYAWVEKYSEETNYGEYQDEMLLVTFIRYNFTREEFDCVAEDYVEHFGSEVTHEEFEVPNVDIIYIFDNEIINEHYRYE